MEHLHHVGAWRSRSVERKPDPPAASGREADAPKAPGELSATGNSLLQHNPCRLEITHGCDRSRRTLCFQDLASNFANVFSARPIGTPRTTRPWMRGSRRTFPHHTTAGIFMLGTLPEHGNLGDIPPWFQMYCLGAMRSLPGSTSGWPTSGGCLPLRLPALSHRGRRWCSSTGTIQDRVASPVPIGPHRDEEVDGSDTASVCFLMRILGFVVPMSVEMTSLELPAMAKAPSLAFSCCIRGLWRWMIGI